jgi:hypothetical protein
MPNINDPVFDESREHAGFRAARARLSRQAGSERLGLSLWELPPGEAAYPYHHHLGEEELIVVLDGRPKPAPYSRLMGPSMPRRVPRSTAQYGDARRPRASRRHDQSAMARRAAAACRSPNRRQTGRP